MKIQICSDLHLEFLVNRDWLDEHPLQAVGEVLVVAGDTYYLDKDYRQLAFLQWAADHFERVYLIPGNHEYYGGFDAATALEPTEELIFSNVHLVNNQTVVYKDVQLIFTTLWSQIRQNALAIQRSMNDFHQIQFRGSPLSIDQFNTLHEAAFSFLAKAVKRAGAKVVVTHHLPSNRCNIPAFRGSLLNEAFCAEKTNFIMDQEIDFWVYGHSHRNLPDFQIGSTTMVTNQLGYVTLQEHSLFDTAKVINVP
ncbi:MAG TPA: metallophosphoesterase [Saprospiraceae bacterium]|nr:metallophosphoesterase [Saprospiraceae bacterium]